MAKAYMERIEALRQQYLNTRVDMDVYNAKYVTEGFKETEGQPWILQKATGYARTCEKKQIYIQDHELLVGGVGFKPRAGILNPDSASGVIEKEVDTISTRPFDPFYLSEEGKKIYLEEVKDYWKNKCVLDRWRLMAPKDMETLRTNGIIFIDRKAVRGYGETTVDWRRLLKVGIGGIKKEAEEALAKLDDAVPGDLEKSFFYRAEIMVADAVIHLAHRHAELAEQKAAECADPARKAELLLPVYPVLRVRLLHGAERFLLQPGPPGPVLVSLLQGRQGCRYPHGRRRPGTAGLPVDQGGGDVPVPRRGHCAVCGRLLHHRSDQLRRHRPVR